MNHALKQIFEHTDNAYLSADDMQLLTAYSASLSDRMAALQDLQQHEAKIAKETTDRIVEVYPKIAARIEGYEKTERDLVLIIRYCGQAMLRDDRQFLNDQLLYWLKTMLQAFKFGENVLYDSYVWMKEASARHLTPASYSLLEPYMNLVLEIVAEGENAA